jgi:sensor histidine kinase regulating citrate/malate metabolism
MYVAAPVVDQGKIIGVLSVGKPNSAMAPVIHRSERRILWAGGALLGIALLIGWGGMVDQPFYRHVVALCRLGDHRYAVAAA